jgi:uncharacterized iron-regulated membrane protein
VHSWLGLHLCLLLGVVCLTGTVATVSTELEWIAVPAARAGDSPTPVSWGTRWDAVQVAYPDVSFERMASGWGGSLVQEDFATRITGTDRAGRGVTAFADPATGRATGRITGVTFPSFMRGLHYYLFDPTGIMFYVLASLGPLLLLIALGGVMTVKKRWRTCWSLPAVRGGLRPWLGAMHQRAGLWALPFIGIMGVTCTWYLVEYDWEVVQDWESKPTLMTDVDTRDVTQIPGMDPGRRISGAQIDAWVAIATAAIPGLAVTGVTLPQVYDGEAYPAEVVGQSGALLVRERSSGVAIDPRTNAVLEIRRAETMPLTERWTHTADPLHFGDFAGLWSKLVWVVFGLALTGLCLSGAWIFLLRTGVIVRTQAP